MNSPEPDARPVLPDSGADAEFSLAPPTPSTREQLEHERLRCERLVTMGTMVAGFAHEVRNPMASLRSLAESLEEELTERDLRFGHLTRMLDVIARVERLVRSWLEFGRPERPRPTRLRPWTLLSSAISLVAPRVRTLGGELRVEVEPELPDVYIDQHQLAQALAVLLDNALDATRSPSRVLIRARSAEVTRDSQPPGATTTSVRGVRFEVCDDGPGIAPDNVERIFDPFFTTKPSGTGLGLSIAQQLVVDNGARLEVQSIPGSRTVFAILTAPAPAAEVAPVIEG